MRNLLVAVSIVFLSISFGCAKKDPTPKNKKDVVASKFVRELECTSFASVKTPKGYLQNNVWNKHSAGDFPWIQCVAERLIDNEIQYGWFWSWPTEGNQIFAQPQITLGQTPWADHHQPLPGYPIAIADLDKLTMSYDVEIQTTGDLNLSSTLWITNLPVIPQQAQKESIVAEIMVWTYTTKDFYPHPAGKKVGEFSGFGQQWEVWHHQNWHDTSGLNKNAWSYIAFRSKQPLLKADYDFIPMINYCIEKGILSNDLFIADIQLGNEVLRGKGETWLKQFDVEIVRKTDQSVAKDI